jgi:hypothetical protein
MVEDQGMDGVAELEWQMTYTNGRGESLTFTRSEVEHFLHCLMHHRLLRVDVQFPEFCKEPLAAASFETGNAVAITYEGDDCITLDIEANSLISSYPRAAADAAKKKKGATK